MKKLKLRRKSWHFRLADKFGWEEYILNPKRGEDGEPARILNDDFCAYLRRVLLGMFLYSLLVFAALFYVYMTVSTLCTLAHGLLNWSKPTTLQAFAIVVNGFILAIGTIWCLVYAYWELGGYELMQKFRAWRKPVRISTGEPSPEPDPFYRAAYETLKNKFCMKIEVSND